MTTEQPVERRYPLAFDSHGNPIIVPESAVAWRVRRGGGRRGRPRNVFDAETGRQLEIPLGSSLEDLIETGCPADRYLLYPVDAEGKVLPGIIAVTEVPETTTDEDQEQAPAGTSLQAENVLQRELIAALKASNDTLCRALEAATSGYGPVRPAAPPAPIMLEAPAPKEKPGLLESGQLAEIAGMVKTLLTTFGQGGGAGNAGGAAPAAVGP